MGMTNQAIGIIIVIFIIGAIGPTAFVMASNSTAYADADPAVKIVMVTLVPILAGIAIALYLLPRRS